MTSASAMPAASFKSLATAECLKASPRREAHADMIGEAVAAMESESTVEVMMQTIHAHPTLYEAMGEAFNAVYGLSINA